jgi:hypothetical protein
MVRMVMTTCSTGAIGVRLAMIAKVTAADASANATVIAPIQRHDREGAGAMVERSGTASAARAI